jgi:hypothetical protein
MSVTRTTTAVTLVFCVLLAGCGGLVEESGLVEDEGTANTPNTSPSTSTPTPASTLGTSDTQSTTARQTTTRSITARSTTQPTATPSTQINPSDPPTDVLGWENGYWHNESIAVDASDGLRREEIGPLLNRSMARVEYLRRHEFTRDISVRMPTRDEVRSLLEARQRSLGRDRALNRYYEMLFMVGEDADAATIVSRNNVNALLGFYIPGSDTIWLVANESGVLLADESLFVHELTHALQDEYKGTVTRAGGPDRARAYRSLVEGEANYIEALFEERCNAGKWNCVLRPSDRQRSIDTVSHPGMSLLGYFPYSDGPAFIHDIYVNGRNGETGWDAVDSLYVNQPQSSAQIIHPKRYPAENSRSPVSIEIVPRNDWIPRVIGSYGEAAVFTMFWQQSYERGLNITDPRSVLEPDGGTYDQYNYTSTPSQGLRDDRVISVTNGIENGYVWVTKWDTQQDAIEFYNAYQKLLTGYNAERVTDNTWVIENGGFADAYYVQRDGTTVTIVNGPTVDDLGEIYPSAVNSNRS